MSENVQVKVGSYHADYYENNRIPRAARLSVAPMMDWTDRKITQYKQCLAASRFAMWFKCCSENLNSGSKIYYLKTVS